MAQITFAQEELVSGVVSDNTGCHYQGSVLVKDKLWNMTD
jgi:hypothetical protein